MGGAQQSDETRGVSKPASKGLTIFRSDKIVEFHAGREGVF